MKGKFEMTNLTLSIGRGLTLAAVCGLASGPMLIARAQSHKAEAKGPTTYQCKEMRASRDDIQAKPTGQNTIAILPWIFQSGTSGAREKASQGLEKLLTNSGFLVRPQNLRQDADRQQTVDLRLANCKDAPDTMAELPTLDQMLQTGKQQGTRYVLAGRAKWHTRAAWGFLSTKTRSTCAVDVQIADTQTGGYALYVRDVVMDSTASTSAFKSAAGFIPYAGFAVGMLSAGPKTPEEQHAVLLATTYALNPWIQTWRQVNGIAETSTAVSALTPR